MSTERGLELDEAWGVVLGVYRVRPLYFGASRRGLEPREAMRGQRGQGNHSHVLNILVQLQVQQHYLTMSNIVSSILH